MKFWHWQKLLSLNIIYGKCAMSSGLRNFLQRIVAQCILIHFEKKKKWNADCIGSQCTKVKSLSGSYANAESCGIIYVYLIQQSFNAPAAWLGESMYLLLRWAWNISSNCVTAPKRTHTVAYSMARARGHKQHDLLTLGVIIFKSRPL